MRRISVSVVRPLKPNTPMQRLSNGRAYWDAIFFLSLFELWFENSVCVFEFILVCSLFVNVCVCSLLISHSHWILCNWTLEIWRFGDLTLNWLYWFVRIVWFESKELYEWIFFLRFEPNWNQHRTFSFDILVFCFGGINQIWPKIPHRIGNFIEHTNRWIHWYIEFDCLTREFAELRSSYGSMCRSRER